MIYDIEYLNSTHLGGRMFTPFYKKYPNGGTVRQLANHVNRLDVNATDFRYVYWDNDKEVAVVYEKARAFLDEIYFCSRILAGHVLEAFINHKTVRAANKYFSEPMIVLPQHQKTRLGRIAFDLSMAAGHCYSVISQINDDITDKFVQEQRDELDFLGAGYLPRSAVPRLQRWFDRVYIIGEEEPPKVTQSLAERLDRLEDQRPAKYL